MNASSTLLGIGELPCLHRFLDKPCTLRYIENGKGACCLSDVQTFFENWSVLIETFGEVPDHSGV
jgi:hypothetical protein